MKKFNERAVRDLRNKLGLNQTEFGMLVGIDQRHISRIERGTHKPSLKTLLKIANACGVDVAIFFAEEIYTGGKDETVVPCLALETAHP